MWCSTFGALCGQLQYVVQDLKKPSFIGLFASRAPHNISQLIVVAGVSWRTLNGYVQNAIPVFSGVLAPRQRTVG
jgi:hypothetical protein